MPTDFVETYVGYGRASGFASPGGLVPNRRHVYVEPSRLGLNQWAFSGDWTVGDQTATLNEPGGRIVHRFRAGTGRSTGVVSMGGRRLTADAPDPWRDLNLVLGTRPRGRPVRFVVLIDGKPPNDAHGLDLDEDGAGTVREDRLYQLVRQAGPITARAFEITFLDAGAQAYVFTSG
jgi:hypothetical protein